jgi:hypothetical protein
MAVEVTVEDPEALTDSGGGGRWERGCGRRRRWWPAGKRGGRHMGRVVPTIFVSCWAGTMG